MPDDQQTDRTSLRTTSSGTTRNEQASTQAASFRANLESVGLLAPTPTHPKRTEARERRDSSGLTKPFKWLSLSKSQPPSSQKTVSSASSHPPIGSPSMPPISSPFSRSTPLVASSSQSSPSGDLAGIASSPRASPSQPQHVPYYAFQSKSNSHSHPYAQSDTMSPVIRTAEPAEEEDCPVCLESLSLRLHGEKPHVIPICGHKLHEACFEAVYGSVSRARNKPGPLGVCGVCRRDMKLGDPSDFGKNKFAALSGLPGAGNNAPLDSHKVRSISKKTLPSDPAGGQATHDPNDDDELPALSRHAHHNSADTIAAAYGNGNANGIGRPTTPFKSPLSIHSNDHVSPTTPLHPFVQPKITVRTEHKSIPRNANQDERANVTCLITVEMPSRLPVSASPSSPAASLSRSTSLLSASLPLPDVPRSANLHSPSSRRQDHEAFSDVSSPKDTPSEDSSHNETFDAIVRDLTTRMADWKGHSPDDFGKLHMYDLLAVQKDKKWSRESYIYLFQEALLCVSGSSKSPVDANGDTPPSTDKLRLKGRIYIRHISKVEDTTDPVSDGPYSLSISMESDGMDAFVILFKSAAQLKAWQLQIEALMKQHLESLKPKKSHSSVRDSTHSTETANSQSGYSTATTTASSTFSRNTRTTVSSMSTSKEMGTLAEEPTPSHPAAFMPHHMGPADSVTTLRHYPNLPHEFPSLDLMLILSVPAATSGPSSYQLKLRIIKSTLDFIFHNIGPRARVSIVTYSAGDGVRGSLRKTPFLAVNKQESKQRLQVFVDALGDDADLEGAVEPREERVNVVTAVNLALDVLLQRKQKSALTGVILMNDGRDGAQKQQMDLVMARAEASAVPIHTFGWGRTHDPSSLWLLANHTRGTYTFVQDLYGLRDSIASCVGGILSIAVTNVKLFVSVQESRWFRIRKVAGVSGAIVSADGRDVDLTLGELRLGERREMLIEVEMAGGPPRSAHQNGSNGMSQYNTATDDFLLKVGLNPLTLEDSPTDFYDDEYFTLTDEVPIFEVNASYRDPIHGKLASRLPHPVLLMITLTPPVDSLRHIPPLSDPAVVRRRVELLCSDMETRCLLLMSRRNPQQAQRLLAETRRIICTILTNLPSMTQDGRQKQTAEDVVASTTLAACVEDVDVLLQGVEQNEQFDAVHRNYAAQSAIVLRDQQSWTGYTATQRLFWKADYAHWMYHKSTEWTT